MKVRENIKDNMALYASYDVMSGDTPEFIAYKHFTVQIIFKAICLMNDITDRFYGIAPMSDYTFDNM